jgi:hypothetical protein
VERQEVVGSNNVNISKKGNAKQTIRMLVKNEIEGAECRIFFVPRHFYVPANFVLQARLLQTEYEVL